MAGTAIAASQPQQCHGWRNLVKTLMNSVPCRSLSVYRSSSESHLLSGPRRNFDADVSVDSQSEW
jgi:hypothetical protein